jgi:hypothetical protein
VVALVSLSGAVAGAGPRARPVPFKSLERGLYGQFADPTLVVAPSVAAWDLAMQELQAEGRLLVVPGPAAPAGADCNSNILVLVALGEFSSAMWKLDVTGVEQVGNRLRVAVCVGAYLPNDLVFTSPYEIIAVRVGSWKPERVECVYDVANPSPSRLGQAPIPAAARGPSPTTDGATWAALKAGYR